MVVKDAVHPRFCSRKVRSISYFYSTRSRVSSVIISWRTTGRHIPVSCIDRRGVDKNYRTSIIKPLQHSLLAHWRMSHNSSTFSEHSYLSSIVFGPFQGIEIRLLSSSDSFASYPTCQSMDSHEMHRRMQGKISDSEGFGFKPRGRAFSTFSLTSLTSLVKSQSVHHICRFEYSDDQLGYVLVNLEHPKGVTNPGDIVMVLTYKWSDQFRLLLESELETVIDWLNISSQARG